jgi:hypothetical protein
VIWRQVDPPQPASTAATSTPAQEETDPVPVADEPPRIASTDMTSNTEQMPPERPPRINRPPREQPNTPADASPRSMTPSSPQTPPEPSPAPTIEAELIAALDAMRISDFDAAETSLAAATTKAGDNADLLPRLASWKELLSFARGYADFRDQALADVAAGNEYDTPAGKVAIVESTGDKFAFRSQGRTVRRSPDTIPILVLEAIVTDWLDDRPANLLYVGAHHFTKDARDFDAARSAWEEATAQGADASLLMPLFDDPAVPLP